MRTASARNFRYVLALMILSVAVAYPVSGRGEAAYPSRPIRIVVPLAVGGAVDSVARVIAPYLTESLGQQIIIDNRPGAGGIIGTDIAAKAVPDGYTLLMWDNSLTVLPNLYKTLPFDAVKDFAPVTSISSVPFVLVVNASSTHKSVAELIAAARAKPNELNYGTAGNGSPPHLAAALLMAMAQASATHVPFKGAPQALTDVIAGRLDFMFASVPVVKAHIDSGKIRGLAVSTAKRTAALPALPTVDESGIRGYDVTVWNGLFAPAGTPKAIVDRLEQQLARLLGQADVREKLAARGADVQQMAPPVFSRYFRQEFPKWARVVERSGAVAQ